MRNKTRTRRNRSNRKNGGAATVFPLKYFDPTHKEPSAASGHNLLEAIPPIGVRPKIGGKRSRRNRGSKRSHRTHRNRSSRRTLRKKGGFVPSVMGGFVNAASKYIVPIALFAGYKLLTKKAKKSRRHSRRH